MNRKKPLRRSTKPIKRSGKRIPSRRKDPAKRAWAKHRNAAYQEYIRGLPCVLSGNGRHGCWGSKVECCHVKTRATGGDDVGNCFPACRWAHERQHWLGIAAFQEYYGVDLWAVARELTEQWLRETSEGRAWQEAHPE